MKKMDLRRASMTVEAAFSLPFFFLCMVMLICALDVYGVYAKKTIELQQKAEKTAALAGSGMSASGIHTAPSGGAGGTGSAGGRTLEDGIVDIPGSVRFQVPGFAFDAASVRLRCRGRVRAWIGYSGEGETDGAEDEERLVYVTDYESVYHTSSDCTHLDLSWEAVSAADAAHRKNLSGKHYHACEKCIGSGGVNGIVYISPQGDSYHNAAGCSGLTRHVHLVKESEISGIHICSRCAAKEKAKAAA